MKIAAIGRAVAAVVLGGCHSSAEPETEWVLPAFNKSCEAPQCGCAQGPTEVEDGQSTVDENTILVTCMNAECLTYLP